MKEAESVRGFVPGACSRLLAVLANLSSLSVAEACDFCLVLTPCCRQSHFILTLSPQFTSFFIFKNDGVVKNFSHGDKGPSHWFLSRKMNAKPRALVWRRDGKGPRGNDSPNVG